LINEKHADVSLYLGFQLFQKHCTKAKYSSAKSAAVALKEIPKRCQSDIYGDKYVARIVAACCS